MKITKYTTCLKDDRTPMLVKEVSKNYPSVQSLNDPEKIVHVMNEVFDASKQTEEHVWLLALTTKCQPIGIFELSHGTVDMSIVSPREVFLKLCLCGASTFVIIHNHPSGDQRPSSKDIQVTKKLDECAKLMGIPLLDHIIIGDTYYSFKRVGIL